MSVIAVFAILVSLLGYLANRNRKTVALSSDLSFLSKIQAPVTLCLIPTSEDSDESDSEASNSEGTDTVVLDEPARSVVRATATTAVAALTKWSASLPSLGGQSYVFTFKMMIHKVNSFEEWAEKVKGVLQESQRQFRPLAEETKSTKATAALKSSRDKEPEPESSESEVCPPASMGADNEVQDRYASALKEQCLVSRRLAKDGGWVYEAATSCIDMKTIERPFRPRRRSTMRPKKNEVIPFPVSHHIDDNEFYDSLKKIDIRERRKTIDDDVDSDSEGDVSDIESEDSGSETADKHNMQFQSRRKSTDRPKTIEVEATPSPFDMLDVPSDDEDFYEALKKIVIRERRTTIVDDVDSDSEWDADDEEWDDEGQGMPSNSTGHRQVEAFLRLVSEDTIRRVSKNTTVDVHSTMYHSFFIFVFPGAGSPRPSTMLSHVFRAFGRVWDSICNIPSMASDRRNIYSIYVLFTDDEGLFLKAISKLRIASMSQLE